MQSSPKHAQTADIAHFVATLRYEDVPPEVFDRLKLLILDSLGCAVFGARLPWSQILTSTLVRLDRTGDCIVWGTSHRLSAPHAALANGSAVQSFELDDVHRQGVLHVGAVTLPPLLAIAQLRRGMTGKDFLRAAVAGYEIGPRVGMCMGQEHIGQGWHSGATVGVFSAAAAASVALGLSPDKTVDALGIAGTQASGLMAAQYGAMVKRMHAGRAAQSGLYGAFLAEQGYTGIREVFESEYGGFCTTFSRSVDRFDLGQLTSGLGRRWETLRIALKFYACVGSNHTTLDAIKRVRERHPFGIDQLERIVVHGSLVTMDHVGWSYKPEGMTSAQLNLAFCVATLLLEGDVFVDQFSEAAVNDPDRIELAKRVEVRHDEGITERGAKFRHMVRVEVLLTDGTVLAETVEYPIGSEHSFATEEEIVAKFKRLADHTVSASQADRIVNVIFDAQKLTSAAKIPEVLSVPR